MRCTACGQENPPEARFCISCSQGLGRSCTACGAESPAQARFCMACAASLDAPNTPESSPTPAPATHQDPGITPKDPHQQPASFAGGRYQVKRFLGEGGKKKVYLAQDTTLDREVAFALIKTEGLDDTSRTRIQREAQAMGRLGSHPHIVTVFDLGQETSTSSGEGQPYMVTELMGGGDVEGLIANASGHRIPLSQAISISRETCRGLEFAHGRGIVHRDLKPGNVWLTSDGVAKIGDFGLAVALDRSRLTTAGMMVGTVSYMPPEQAMGGEVTPTSDLYSLGAMLYEMVTGRPPFLGDDSVSVIGQHINTPPVAPTWHNSECPRSLDALILRLLSKSPSERPDSASDVLAALEAIDVTHDAGAQGSVGAGPPSHNEEHALDSLAGGVFVGRQQEMGELKGCLEDALSGRGRMVTLVGEPGIGKSRTAQELATYAGLRGAQVLWGRCYEEQGAPPYWPWVQAIRSYVREKEPDEIRSEMGAGAEDIAEIVSDVRERLPGLGTPPQLEPEQARFRLFDSITAFLKSAGRGRPLVLVLDDLHWADHPSLLLLEFIARELSGSRVLLVGTYRDMELSRRHPLALTLGGLTRERLFQRVLLRGLGQEDVGRFIELVSGAAPPRGMVEAVHRQTEGNPLFVTEVVRLLVQEGQVGASRSNRDAPTENTSDSWNVRIPEGVREVIGRRLDRLSERCNETLTIGAVIGREFELRQLSPLVEDMTEDRLLEVLEEALSSRVIEELPQSVGRYQFTHALIQETLAGELSITRRVRLHGQIAEALEAMYGDDAEAHASELAHHFGEAQTSTGPEKLVRYSLLAGERALESYAYEEAQAHFQRGLVSKGIAINHRGPAVDAESAALLFGLGRAQLATLETYRLQEAVTTMSRAFDYYAESGDLDHAVAVAQHPLPTATGRVSGAGALISRALDLVSPDSLEAAQLLSSHGRVLGLEEGDYERAQEVFARSQLLAQQRERPDVLVRTLVSAAEVDLYHGRLEESSANGLRAVEIASSVDDPRGELLAHFCILVGNFLLGETAGLDKHAEAMLATAERLRHHFYLAGRAMFGNSILARSRGDYAAALEFNERGLAVSPRETRLLLGSTIAQYELGNFEKGGEYMDRLLDILQNSAPGPTIENSFAPIALFRIARITGGGDHLDLAKRTAEANLAAPWVTPLVAEINQVVLALAAVREGDRDSASTWLDTLKPMNRSGGVSIIAGILPAHVLALLAQTIGDPVQTVRRFEDTLALCRKGGFRPELAWACCDYADALREQDDPNDKAKAIELLDESLAISSELGLRPLMERVLARREILRA